MLVGMKNKWQKASYHFAKIFEEFFVNSGYSEESRYDKVGIAVAIYLVLKMMQKFPLKFF